MGQPLFLNGVIGAGGAALAHGNGDAGGIVEEVQHRGAVGHPGQLGANVIVVVNDSAHGLGGPLAACIVAVADAAGAVGCTDQFSTMLPGKAPPGAVVIARRIVVIPASS